jgi:hypothetical protein
MTEIEYAAFKQVFDKFKAERISETEVQINMSDEAAAMLTAGYFIVRAINEG